MKERTQVLLVVLVLLSSCGISNRIRRDGREVIGAKALETAHVGISIFDPSTKKYLYDHHGDRYFIPASNTKIATCYAAMKYLGDRLIGIHWMERDTALFIYPTGDPTLLHPDFPNHPVYDFLKKAGKNVYVVDVGWDDLQWGSGWSWNDYDQSYMAEKSPLPVYGNLVKWVQEKGDSAQPATIYSVPEVNWRVTFNAGTRQNFLVRRELAENSYTITEGREKKREISIPFATHGSLTSIELLRDTLDVSIDLYPRQKSLPLRTQMNDVYSQATDSMLAIMMHSSDNFFAEQVLLMVSDRLMKTLSSSRARDSILNKDFADLPQKPRWADGSGLSRYNLFSPRDMIAILDKMRNEFGMERIRVIFPTGGEGTISNYYKSDSGFVYAKTGTLSGVLAFSGFLYTKKGRLLIFSTQVNNHQASVTDIRRIMENFLQKIRNDY
jgi:serine-type D-Ala-D-Ala carboxypeptidase/endopeptidase (penicillin-binding protein 4)